MVDPEVDIDDNGLIRQVLPESLIDTEINFDSMGKASYITSNQKLKIQTKADLVVSTFSDKPIFNLINRPELKGSILYVYTTDKKIRVINDHFNYKHITISPERIVKCAGMIKLDSNGKITRIDNNSGHYKPQKIYLERFVEHLKKSIVDLDSFVAIDYFSVQRRIPGKEKN